MSETDPHRHIAMGKNVAAGYALSNIIKAETYVDDLIREVGTKFDNLAETN